MNRRPSGRCLGHNRRPPLSDTTLVSTGTPPPADTREMRSPWTVANRMSPCRPQLPDTPTVIGTSHTLTGAPPDRSTRLSCPPTMKPSALPSGDQNIELAPSVPETSRAVSSPSDRTRIFDGTPARNATNATVEPSGDTETLVDSIPVPTRAPVGGASANRTGSGASNGDPCDLPPINHQVAPVASAAAMSAI